MPGLSSFVWILAGGLLVPLVSLAAGSLLGGALFPMLPEGMAAMAPRRGGFCIAAGFTAFLALEQVLHWHHSHHEAARPRAPVAVLILLGDALHNFIGGLGIASTFLMNPAAGVAAWFAAVAHEVPQELGDFAILVHSGWKPSTALRWTVISALTFPLGAVLAWFISRSVSVAELVLFASGNFLYIAASDRVPEIKAGSSLRSAVLSVCWFSAGLLLMLVLAR